ncbi:XAP5, circadian clock regulator-domain-containing protein [Lipomyces kononenkoae]|uniref:XAP5, circadian clock regulator-domain-containing protein n=1 Tax=Lipomyces kononenkoae TaxID=34357 RepID=A0ACC3T4P4_LIPKO
MSRRQRDNPINDRTARKGGTPITWSGVREFETKSASLEDMIHSETVGLVDRERLAQLREEFLAKRKLEEAGPSQNDSEATMSGSDGASDRDAKLAKTPKRKKGVQVSKLSFADGDEEEGQQVHEVKSKSIEDKQMVKKRRKVDPTVDTSFLITKETDDGTRQEQEDLENEFLRRQEQVREEKVDLQFCYFDGTYIPGKVTVKKGDQIWVMLDRTRKGKKEFHRGTVDDIMFVKDNIIIPHHYDFHYFIVNKVKTKAGLLFDFEHPDEDIKRTKVVHRNWYEKNKHIFPASIWREFDPEVDYTTLVLRDSQGFVLYQQ